MKNNIPKELEVGVLYIYNHSNSDGWWKYFIPIKKKQNNVYDFLVFTENCAGRFIYNLDVGPDEIKYWFGSNGNDYLIYRGKSK